LKKLLRLLALVGATIFGLASITMIAVLVYSYSETYRLSQLPPSVRIQPYHRFPIDRLNHDLRQVTPLVFAFICCALVYRYSLTWGKKIQNSPLPGADDAQPPRRE